MRFWCYLLQYCRGLVIISSNFSVFSNIQTKSSAKTESTCYLGSRDKIGILNYISIFYLHSHLKHLTSIPPVPSIVWFYCQSQSRNQGPPVHRVHAWPSASYLHESYTNSHSYSPQIPINFFRFYHTPTHCQCTVAKKPTNPLIFYVGRNWEHLEDQCSHRECVKTLYRHPSGQDWTRVIGAVRQLLSEKSSTPYNKN